MTDKEMDKLAGIVAKRVVDVIEARQKAWDIEFHADMQHFVSDNRANDINEEIKKIKSKLK